MSTGVGDIFLDLKLNKQPFERGLNETKAMGSAVGKKIGLAIAGAIAGAVATVGFGHLISATAELGDAIDKTSQKMGMSAQTYQEWDFIMQRCGTSMESMTTAMKTLASSASTSKDALAELGISQEEVASLSQEQLFARTISALQNVEDTTRRTYLAGQLLGRGATELGAVLNMSAQETNELRNRVYELGGVMSQEAVTSSAMYSDALLDLRMAFRGISDTVATTVLPILTSAINKVIIPLVLRAVAVIRYFGNILRSAFGGLGKKLGGVFGASQQKQNISFGKSLGGISKGIGGAGKSAKKAKKAVKELNRELMGFDKMNKLAKKSKSSDSGGGGKVGGGGGGVGGVGGGGIEPMGLDDTNGKLGLFGKLSEKLRPIWRALGEVFSAVIRLFKALGKALAPVGKWIWEHLIKPFGKLLGMAIVAILEGIAGAINLLASFIEKHPKIAVILMGIGTALLMIMKRGAIIKFLSKFGKMFGIVGKMIMAHPIAILITAIALAIGYIYQNWDKIKKTKFGKVLIKIGNVLKSVGGKLKELGIAFGTWLVPKIKNAIRIAKEIVSVFKEKLKKAIDIVTHPLKSLSNAWNAIKSKAVDLKASLAGMTQKALDAFKGAWDSIKAKGAKLTATLAGVKQKALDTLKDAWDAIKPKTATLKKVLAGVGQRELNGLKNIWEFIKDKKATLTKALAGAKQTAIDALKNAWSNIKNKTATITSKIGGLGKSAIEKFASAWDSINGRCFDFNCCVCCVIVVYANA